MQDTPNTEVPQPAPVTPPVDQPVSPQPVSSAPRKNNLTLLVGGLLLLGLLGGGAYFAADMVNSPAIVKEKASAATTAFEDLQRSLAKVAEYLKEDSNASEADAYEREVERGKGLVNNAVDDLEALNDLIDGMTNTNLNAYKAHLQEYAKQAKTLLDLGEEAIKLGEGYIDPIRRYEEMTLNLAGVSSYLYSQPDRYADEVNSAVETEREIISDIESIDLKGEFDKYNKAFVENMKVEVAFLERMVSAVDNRDDDAITQAQQTYAQDVDKTSKELNRVNDEIKRNIEDLENELEEIGRKAEKELSNLKSKYKF